MDMGSVFLQWKSWAVAIGTFSDPCKSLPPLLRVYWSFLRGLYVCNISLLRLSTTCHHLRSRDDCNP